MGYHQEVFDKMIVLTIQSLPYKLDDKDQVKRLSDLIIIKMK